MNCNDMDDLYSDLPEDITSTHIIKLENEVQNLQVRVRELQGIIKSHESNAEDVRKQLICVQQENTVLRTNISSLYRTAKAEIDRKNQQLEESRKSTYQSSGNNKVCVENSVNSRKEDRNANELSNETRSLLVQENYEIMNEDYQRELFGVGKTLKAQKNSGLMNENDQDELSSVEKALNAQRNNEIVNENYQDDLSRVRKTLKQLIDEILHNNDLQFNSNTAVCPYGKSIERNCSLLFRRHDRVVPNRNSDDDAGLSEVSSISFSDDEIETRNEKPETENVWPKKRRRSSRKELKASKKLLVEASLNFSRERSSR